MLKRFEEYGKFAEITAFTGAKISDAKLFAESVSAEIPKTVEAQFFDADLIATWQHLYFAALNALVAFKVKRNVCKSIAVETALYASAQRQIKKAFDVVGLKPESSNAAVLILGSNSDSVKAGLAAVSKLLGREPDDAALELSAAKTKRIRSAFRVSNAELEAVSSACNPDEALVDLIVERVALLPTRL